MPVRYRYTQASLGQYHTQERREDVRIGLSVPNSDYTRFLNDAFAKTGRAAALNEKEVAQLKEDCQERNGKVIAALVKLTGADVYPDANAWWQWWNDDTAVQAFRVSERGYGVHVCSRRRPSVVEPWRTFLRRGCDQKCGASGGCFLAFWVLYFCGTLSAGFYECIGVDG